MAFAEPEIYFSGTHYTIPLTPPLPSVGPEIHPIMLGADSDLDFVVSYSMSGVSPTTYAPLRLLRNNGGVLSDASADLIGSPAMIGSGSSATGDFDGNGRQDIFLMGGGLDMEPFGGEQSRILMQTTDGKVTDETAARLPVNTTDMGLADSGDIDGDNDLDIFAADYTGPVILEKRFLINDGTGHFAADLSRIPPGPIDPSISCAFADADRDGDLDLIIGGCGGGCATIRDSIALNDGTGHFSYAPETYMPLRIGGSDYSTFNILPGDFDNDSYPDLLLGVCSVDATTAQLFLNNGDGSFRDISNQVDPSAGTWMVDELQFIADMNGDGWMDCCTRGFPSRILYNIGGGFFISPPLAELLSGDANLWDAYPQDIDGDGDTDLISFGGNDYWVLENVNNYNALDGDADGDGLTNRQEILILNMGIAGDHDGPFNPFTADSTGDNEDPSPDGVPDGQNDWDGDGMSNRNEFTWGFNPIDPESYGVLPAVGIAGYALLIAVVLGAALVWLRRLQAGGAGALNRR